MRENLEAVDSGSWSRNEVEEAEKEDVEQQTSTLANSSAGELEEVKR